MHCMQYWPLVDIVYRVQFVEIRRVHFVEIRRSKYHLSVLSDGIMECLYELGLADGSVKDFQISATSWKTGHAPQMVRPTLESWCPADSDTEPYIQV